MEGGKTEWQFDGMEGGGQTALLLNLRDDADDSCAPVVMVRGRNAEQVARKLAQLMNEAGFNEKSATASANDQGRG